MSKQKVSSKTKKVDINLGRTISKPTNILKPKVKK